MRCPSRMPVSLSPPFFFLNYISLIARGWTKCETPAGKFWAWLEVFSRTDREKKRHASWHGAQWQPARRVRQMDPPNEILDLLERLVSAVLAHQNHGHRLGASRVFRHCPCVTSQLTIVTSTGAFRSSVSAAVPSYSPPVLSARTHDHSVEPYTSSLTNTRFAR